MGISFDYMHVDWFMVVCIEHEPESKKYKYCRHTSFIFVLAKV